MTQTEFSPTIPTKARTFMRFRSLIGIVTLVLGSLLGTACYRATGIQRGDVAAVEIPAVGGDRVAGLKSAAGPGDYYLGNDFVELAVDGTLWGAQEEALAGAVSGGSIVDAGVVFLDQNYLRVSYPSDGLDRLTPVVNQDPRIPLVFTSCLPFKVGDICSLEMHGSVYDPNNLIVPADHQPDGRVQNVEVIHTLSLHRMDRFFSLQTKVINHGSTPVGIKNLADALIQRGGGYRPLIPASEDQAGNPLTPSWGVELPGIDFNNPLPASVKAPMVGFMAAESTAHALDSHGSMGLLPVDEDQFLVASDAQHALTESRPVYARTVVAGGLPITQLAPGASLVHNRRMYLVGGNSVSDARANQCSGLFNLLIADRASLRSRDYGLFSFSTFGSAALAGPVQTEIRFERNVGTTASPIWRTERVEWQEPPDGPSSFGSLTVLLPVGQYRVSVRNRAVATPLVTTEMINIGNTDMPDLKGPILVQKDVPFYALDQRDLLCPERDQIMSAVSGTVNRNLFHSFAFGGRSTTALTQDLQPMRITLSGAEDPDTHAAAPVDPDWQRQRRYGCYFDVVNKRKLPSSFFLGEYTYQAGNQIFGSAFYTPITAWFKTGYYEALASRGPLNPLDQIGFEVFDGQQSSGHTFVLFPGALPSGWTSFDIPGPSHITTGGYHPSEILTSALSEGVQVVARTEEDQLISATGVYNDYRADFTFPGTFSDEQRLQLGGDPYVVGARSSRLTNGGMVTALFTPEPCNLRRGGARSSVGWTLADFLAQADGQFNVIHRPRGPQGLFTANAYNRTLALASTPWWNATGIHSLGRKNGDFDALELIRADFPDSTTGMPKDLSVAANATSWFNEFLQVRADWFAILKQQTPTFFTKALGCSSAQYSLDTPVGLARTYLKAASFSQDNLEPVLTALRSGAAVASTGPLLDVSVGNVGPGGLVSGSSAISLNLNLYAPDWVPVDEIRIVVNGTVVRTLSPTTDLSASTTDTRLRTGSVALTVSADSWIVVEAGVPLNTTGAYRAGSSWARIMKGTYPIAVTNPIFVDVAGNGYTPPGLP